MYKKKKPSYGSFFINLKLSILNYGNKVKNISMTSTMSRSEREAMEKFANREWCQETTACQRAGQDGATMFMNIELIYLKMYGAVLSHPYTIQDVARTLPLQARPWEAAILEVLRMGAFVVDSTTPLQSQHIEFVKSLRDEFLDRLDELQSWEGINSGTSAARWTEEEQAEADAAAAAWEDLMEGHRTVEETETDKKRKESCIETLKLLESVMESGERMKEVDYLKMCNLLKGLYN